VNIVRKMTLLSKRYGKVAVNRKIKLTNCLVFTLLFVVSNVEAQCWYWGERGYFQTTDFFFQEAKNACVDAGLHWGKDATLYFCFLTPTTYYQRKNIHFWYEGGPVKEPFQDGAISYADINFDAAKESCENPLIDEKNPPLDKHFCAGNPITIGTGNKYQKEIDYPGTNSSELQFSRSYSSQSIYSSAASANSNDSYMGINWRHNYSQQLTVFGADANRRVTVIRPDGRKLIFREQTSGLFLADPDVTSSLVPVYENDTQLGWVYQTTGNVTETYNNQGQLQTIRKINGTELMFLYDVDTDLETLDQITDSTGRTLKLFYDTNRHIEKIMMPDNTEISYVYDSSERLTKVLFASGTEIRTYHYENTTYPHHLTGLTDETGVRFATWTYDSEGRAISSEHTGGVDKSTLDYSVADQVTVTNPLGKDTTYHFTTLHGVKKVTQVEGHATASCAGANQNYTYDANGYMASKTDWQGNVTTYVHDSRGLETSRTEASGTAEARTITTTWHPDFRLPTQITEPGKLTSFTYDANGRLLSQTVN